MTARKPTEAKPKHSAIASLMWQWHDEMETKVHWWAVNDKDAPIVSTSVSIALQEQCSSLAKMLVRTYGERKP